MTTKLNGKEYRGTVGFLLAIPIIVFTFLTIALVFTIVALAILAPLVFIVVAIIELLARVFA